MKELFGFQIPEPLFWVIVAVVIIAVIAAIAIPIYKGYKAELEGYDGGTQVERLTDGGTASRTGTHDDQVGL